MQAEERASRARQNFESGCNCPQSVVGAFDDVVARQGMDPEVALRLASPFGGGMGRLREVCGAVSGSLMVLGLVEGYSDPTIYDGKARLYEQVQELAARFREENGSILCRELLGLEEGPSSARPEERTESYYAARPCAELCASAARILSEHLGE